VIGDCIHNRRILCELFTYATRKRCIRTVSRICENIWHSLNFSILHRSVWYFKATLLSLSPLQIYDLSCDRKNVYICICLFMSLPHTGICYSMWTYGKVSQLFNSAYMRLKFHKQYRNHVCLATAYTLGAYFANCSHMHRGNDAYARFYEYAKIYDILSTTQFCTDPSDISKLHSSHCPL